MSEARVAVLIINWNGADDTIALLRSLQDAATAAIRLCVCVVDNASNDGDFQQLDSFIRDQVLGYQVTLIRNRENIGVPSAYNQGIIALGTEFDAFLRLDNDVVLPPRAIDTLLKALVTGRSKFVGIVGGNVKYLSAPALDNGGAVAIDLIRGTTTVTYPTEDTECDSVLGCVMLLDGDMVRALTPKVFCGDLFICTDESELSLRARLQGWRTLYLSTVVGYHKSGASTSKATAMASYFTARNWAFLRLRYCPGLLAKLSIFGSIGFYSILRLIQLRPTYFLGSISGACIYFAFLLDAGFVFEDVNRNSRCQAH